MAEQRVMEWVTGLCGRRCGAGVGGGVGSMWAPVWAILGNPAT